MVCFVEEVLAKLQLVLGDGKIRKKENLRDNPSNGLHTNGELVSTHKSDIDEQGLQICMQVHYYKFRCNGTGIYP